MASYIIIASQLSSNQVSHSGMYFLSVPFLSFSGGGVVVEWGWLVEAACSWSIQN